MTEYHFPLGRGGEFVLDSDGVAELLRSPDMVGAVQAAANAIALELGNRGYRTVWVSTYATDRQAASVAIPGHGIADELLAGSLIDAATTVGLEVNTAL